MALDVATALAFSFFGVFGFHRARFWPVFQACAFGVLCLLIAQGYAATGVVLLIAATLFWLFGYFGRWWYLTFSAIVSLAAGRYMFIASPLWTLAAVDLCALLLPWTTEAPTYLWERFETIIISVVVFMLIVGIALAHAVGTGMFLFTLWHLFLRRFLVTLPPKVLGPQLASPAASLLAAD